MMQDVHSFLWVFSKIHLSLYSIVPLMHRPIALTKSCKQVKPCSHFICLRIAKLFIFGSHCVHVMFISWQAPGNILFQPKVTTPCHNCLVLFLNQRALLSHKLMFSHFCFLSKNLWYKQSLTVQSILGSSM